jgi:GH24 family phage-related lysozyme (muramidase)
MQGDSTTNPDIYENIIHHIMHEEGFRDRPYRDPNPHYVDIGYGHVIYRSDKPVKKDLSDVPVSVRNTRWNKTQAIHELANIYQTHRNTAVNWLADNGIEDGRLADQLGMLFYGATGQSFRDSYAANEAIEKGDTNALSLAASRWGRHADGQLLPVLVARRNAERMYYLGKELPVSKEEEETGTLPPTSIKQQQRAAAPTGGAPGDASQIYNKLASQSGLRGSSGYNPMSWGSPRDPMELYRQINDQAKSIGPALDLGPAPRIPMDPEDIAQASSMLGAGGAQRANEVVWKIVGGKDAPMPDDFDAMNWVGELMQQKPSPQEEPNFYQQSGRLPGVGEFTTPHFAPVNFPPVVGATQQGE